MTHGLALIVFVTIVERGSLVAAAKTLRLSVPTVSRHLAQLETHLGTRLLQRTTRSLSLTEEGRRFYEKAKVITGLIQDVEQEFADNRFNPAGLIKIAAPVAFGQRYLSALWPRFLQTYPDVQLDITLESALSDVVAEGYDVTIRVTQLQDSNLVAHHLGDARYVLCASPDYLAAHGQPQHPDDLLSHRLVGYSKDGLPVTWQMVDQAGQTHALTPRFALRTNNAETLLQACVAGLGIGMLFDFMLCDELATGRLQTVLPDALPVPVGIYALTYSRRLLPLRVQCLLDFLKTAFRQPEHTWG